MTIQIYHNNEIPYIDIPNRVKSCFAGHNNRILYEVLGLGYIMKIQTRNGIDYQLFLSESYDGTDLEGRIKLKEIADELFDD